MCRGLRCRRQGVCGAKLQLLKWRHHIPRAVRNIGPRDCPGGMPGRALSFLSGSKFQALLCAGSHERAFRSLRPEMVAARESNKPGRPSSALEMICSLHQHRQRMRWRPGALGPVLTPVRCHCSFRRGVCGLVFPSFLSSTAHNPSFQGGAYRDSAPSNSTELTDLCVCMSLCAGAFIGPPCMRIPAEAGFFGKRGRIPM